jgi:hypothetical protein
VSAVGVSALLLPLDAARRVLLRAAGPSLRPLFSRRDLRVAAMGATAVLVGIAAAVAAPLWLLLLGPLLLGVAHLLADVRYLLVRQGFLRRPEVVLAVLLPAALTLAAPRAPLGAVALIGAAAVARAAPRRRLLAIVATGLALLALTRWEPLAARVFAHAHNLVALGVWAWWARRPAGWRWLVPALALVGAALIAGGAFDALALRPQALAAPVPGFDLGRAAQELSPVDPATHPLAAARWVWSFAFLQSLHYAVWLRLIPDEDRARVGPRGFVASLRAAVSDLGAAPVALTLTLTLALLAWAAFAAGDARAAYLRLAFGHGYVELAALLLLALEGGGRRADGGRLGA